MAIQHTPGPWIFYADLPSTEPNWHIVTTANKMRVLANVHIEPGNAMDLANANLIAAAPELLEALLKAESLIDTLTLACLDRVDTSNDERVRAISAAITKATGSA